MRLSDFAALHDEKRLLLRLFALHGRGAYKPAWRVVRGFCPFSDEVARQMGIPEKRALGWVYKWEGRGWWDSGVTSRSGWFTEKGALFAQALDFWEAAPGAPLPLVTWLRIS